MSAVDPPPPSAGDLGSRLEFETLISDTNMAQVSPWSARKVLVERAPVRVSRMADLPPDADTERQSWIQMPIRSALVLPVDTGGTVGRGRR